MNDDIDKVLAGAEPPMPPSLQLKIREGIKQQTAPVKPLMSGGVYAFGLFVVFLSIGTLCAWLTGFSGVAKLSRTELVAFLLVLTAVSVAAARAVSRSMRPAGGSLHTSTIVAGSMVLYEALVLSCFRDYSTADFIPLGVGCLILGLKCGLVAAVPGWLIIRKGFFVEPAKAGALVGLLGGLSGWLGLTLHCPILTTPHAGVWHAVVVPICVLLGVIAGRVLRTA